MSNKQAKIKPSDIEQSYKRVFGTPEGKLVFEDLKKVLHHGRTIYKSNPQDLAFDLGRQSVANDIQFILDKQG